MKVVVTCRNREDSNYVYDLLVNEHMGEKCLRGMKTCVDSHEMLDQNMVFDLTDEEIEELKKLPQVLDVNFDFGDEFIVNYAIQKKNITGIPQLANASSNKTNLLSHSLLYGQEYDLKYVQESLPDKPRTLHTINCSNVDILLLDSGFDQDHPDLKNDDGQSVLKQFDWTQLTEPDEDGVEKPIINSLPPNLYTNDESGHGTSCASLILGKRCGFARNANLYFYKSGTDGLKLALAFLKAKKQNKFGLDRNNPTILSISWGTDIDLLNPAIKDENGNLLFDDDDHKKLIKSINLSELDSNIKLVSYPRAINSVSPVNNEYTRKIIKEGGHFIRAAGNSNLYVDINSPEIPFITFSYKKKDSTQQKQTSFLLGTKKMFEKFVNKNKKKIWKGFIENTEYEIEYTGRPQKTRLYASPEVGYDEVNKKIYDRNEYPIIIVGDISVVGTPISSTDLKNSANPDSENAYKCLTDKENKIDDEKRINLNDSVRYTSRKGPFFIKTYYSNFGPYVDVYAPGSNVWSACSKTKTPQDIKITYNSPDNSNFKYVTFNGTSAACPIVAGILATYLSQFPNATPKQAKDWLIKNSLTGSIMETTKTTNKIEFVDVNGGSENLSYKYPVGADLNNVSSKLIYKYSLYNAIYSSQKVHKDELLFVHRFFDTGNLIPQAYPLRKAILSATESTKELPFANTTLKKGKETSAKVTHK